MPEGLLTTCDSTPVLLTSMQRQVVEVLSSVKYKKHSLADWFLGAVYAAKNTYNPDRFSQAAQSLRELLEKFPRVFVESEIQGVRPNFQEMRNNLHSQLSSDKERYKGIWKGKQIDGKLNKTIQGVDKYFELNQVPTRREQINSAMNCLDPMSGTLDQKIRLEKSKRFQSIWEYFEALAHHKASPDETKFWEQLDLAERLIVDLLAPITAQDQGSIREILSKAQPEQVDVEKLFDLIKRRGANYAYFFKTVTNPFWINPLLEKHFFKDLPGIESTGDGHINFPIWWPILFLQRVAAQAPEQVVDVILGFNQTDNPRILREIFAIACDLQDTALSLRLKPLILKFLESPYRWGEENLIIKILKKWGQDQGASRDAAYKILKFVIAFQEDPKAAEKQSRHKEDPEAIDTLLEPAPRFRQWEYQQILEKGVRSLADYAPYQVACILINAVANMIKLKIHQEDLEKRGDQECLEFWCRRLDTPGQYQDIDKVLVQTLTYACEKVYENALESVEELDRALRVSPWRVFKRLRQYLYAAHPSDQTLPWIRGEILTHDGYSECEHHYEFQVMIRKACEHFGPRLLNADEQKEIFGAILSGPSKEDFREWRGERYSDEDFQQYQRRFHRIQLRPFAALLDDETRRYFNELEGESSAKAITDNDYAPSEVTVGTITDQSPKSAAELKSLTDEDLLAYFNDWEDEHRDRDNSFVRITVSALAETFQSLFKEKIMPDDGRRDFWLMNRNRIARPIYISAMLKIMADVVRGKNFDNLNQWIEFCEWVLSHPDTVHEKEQPKPREESRDHPDWSRARRAVVDFIEVCIDKETETPITARRGLASLLEQVCCQSDWRLDGDHPVLSNRDDLITEAINNTRSRALESLVLFGFWVRRQMPEEQVPEVAGTLTKRIREHAEFPLTPPERALLGMLFGNICILDGDWAVQQREKIFPQKYESAWREAFGSYLRFNRSSPKVFEILRGQFEYALENLHILVTGNSNGKELIDILGQHLFIYYLWEFYPLTGDDSLLERFYDKTRDEPERWGQLFDSVGRLLRSHNGPLDSTLSERITAFFDWRFNALESSELQEFTFWLEAECLDPVWRLQSYSKILTLGRGKDMGLSLQVRGLNKLLPMHPALVVECFAKLTDTLDQGKLMFISVDEAKPILRAGLAAKDPQVHKNAVRAQDNLLKRGDSAYLEI